MKPTTGITLPASFVVTVSLAGAESPPTAAADNEILTVSEVAELLKCKPSSIYNLTRLRGREMYDNPIPVIPLPMGLRFRRASVLGWLVSKETTSVSAGVQRTR
jgi:hypothetical protein